MRRRRPASIPLFLVIALAFSQAGSAARHGGVLERTHGRGTRWRSQDVVRRRQLEAGVEALGLSVTLDAFESPTTSTPGASEYTSAYSDSTLASVSETPVFTSSSYASGISEASTTTNPWPSSEEAASSSSSFSDAPQAGPSTSTSGDSGLSSSVSSTSYDWTSSVPSGPSFTPSSELSREAESTIAPPAFSGDGSSGSSASEYPTATSTYDLPAESAVAFTDSDGSSPSSTSFWDSDGSSDTTSPSAAPPGPSYSDEGSSRLMTTPLTQATTTPVTVTEPSTYAPRASSVVEASSAEPIASESTIQWSDPASSPTPTSFEATEAVTATESADAGSGTETATSESPKPSDPSIFSVVKFLDLPLHYFSLWIRSVFDLPDGASWPVLFASASPVRVDSAGGARLSHSVKVRQAPGAAGQGAAAPGAAGQGAAAPGAAEQGAAAPGAAGQGAAAPGAVGQGAAAPGVTGQGTPPAQGGQPAQPESPVPAAQSAPAAPAASAPGAPDPAAQGAQAPGGPAANNGGQPNPPAPVAEAANKGNTTTSTSSTSTTSSSVTNPTPSTSSSVINPTPTPSAPPAGPTPGVSPPNNGINPVPSSVPPGGTTPRGTSPTFPPGAASSTSTSITSTSTSTPPPAIPTGAVDWNSWLHSSSSSSWSSSSLVLPQAANTSSNSIPGSPVPSSSNATVPKPSPDQKGLLKSTNSSIPAPLAESLGAPLAPSVMPPVNASNIRISPGPSALPGGSSTFTLSTFGSGPSASVGWIPLAPPAALPNATGNLSNPAYPTALLPVSTSLSWSLIPGHTPSSIAVTLVSGGPAGAGWHTNSKLASLPSGAPSVGSPSNQTLSNSSSPLRSPVPPIPGQTPTSNSTVPLGPTNSTVPLGPEQTPPSNASTPPDLTPSSSEFEDGMKADGSDASQPTETSSSDAVPTNTKSGDQTNPLSEPVFTPAPPPERTTTSDSTPPWTPPPTPTSESTSSTATSEVTLTDSSVPSPPPSPTPSITTSQTLPADPVEDTSTTSDTTSSEWSPPPTPTSTSQVVYSDSNSSSTTPVEVTPSTPPIISEVSPTSPLWSTPSSTSTPVDTTLPAPSTTSDLVLQPPASVTNSGISASAVFATEAPTSASATSLVGGDTTSDAAPSLVSVTSTPDVSGSQVQTFSTSASYEASSSLAASESPSDTPITSSTDDAYTPTQTWLIVATTSSSPAAPATTSAPPTTTAETGTTTTASLPSTASIPSSIPTMIVPADSAINQPNAGTGSSDDPLKDDTLIAILLAAAEYPWAFVVNSSDATSQLFNTFPTLIGNALNINVSDVQTYGLMVYQPASWNGDEASLLTQWLAYIPTQYFATLEAYLKTQSSPLYNQTGIQGQLASQINTAFPLAATTGAAATATSGSAHSSNSRTRDIIIGVCVSVGGLLWLGLVFWIYKRVKRSNDRAVHKRLSEHMSMFSGQHDPDYGGTVDDRRASRVPSIAASDIDDRPSSFYASPVENDRSMRDQQREELDEDQLSYHGSGHHESPTTYGPSVFGNSWFAQPGQPAQPQMRQARASQNPFEDIVTKSYLTTSGSATGLASTAQRRSTALGKPVQVQKGMISQPTLQANSLEFREQQS